MCVCHAPATGCIHRPGIPPPPPPPPPLPCVLPAATASLLFAPPVDHSNEYPQCRASIACSKTARMWGVRGEAQSKPSCPARVITPFARARGYVCYRYRSLCAGVLCFPIIHKTPTSRSRVPPRAFASAQLASHCRDHPHPRGASHGVNPDGLYQRLDPLNDPGNHLSPTMSCATIRYRSHHVFAFVSDYSLTTHVQHGPPVPARRAGRAPRRPRGVRAITRAPPSRGRSSTPVTAAVRRCMLNRC